MPKYTDIYVRDSLQDDGTYPSTQNPCCSPDIIPYQGDTLDVQTAVSKYTSDVGKSIINGGVNNIYVRAKNLSAATTAGTVALYYSKASLLMRPSNWKDNVVRTASGLTSVPFYNQSAKQNLAPNEIGLTEPAFYLSSLPPDPKDHYCLVAVVNTPAHQVTIPPDFRSNTEFAQWVKDSPAVAFHNVVLIPNPKTEVVITGDFKNLDASDQYFYLGVVGSKMPVNTTVRMQNSDSRCPIDKVLRFPKPDAKGRQIDGFQTSIPGRYEGTVTASATFPPNSKPEGATFTVVYYQVPDLTNALELAVAAEHPAARIRDGRPRTETASLIKLGQITVRLGVV